MYVYGPVLCICLWSGSRVLQESCDGERRDALQVKSKLIRCVPFCQLSDLFSVQLPYTAAAYNCLQNTLPIVMHMH